jgi:precorrin-6B methylase 2
MDNVVIEKEFIEAIKDIVIILKERDYSKIAELPYVKGGIFSIINDFTFLFGRRDSIFESSLFYNLRRWSFNNKDIVILNDFFIHNKTEKRSIICSILGEDKVNNFLNLNIMSEVLDERGNSLLRSQIRIIPFNGEYFISDPFDRAISDFVWIGKDSILLANRLKNMASNGKFVVDIGSGSGIQAIILSNNSDSKVIAVDINEKCLRYGKVNAIINRKTNVHFVKSDMLSAIKCRLDTIVSNPPFIFLPSDEEKTNRDGYGGVFGIEKTIRILENMPQHLNAGGKAILLTLSPVISGKNLLIEEVKKILSNGYIVCYEIIDYVYMKEYRNFYDSKKISYFVQGILEVSKEKNPCAVQMTIKDISRIKKLLSFIKIAGTKVFYKNYVDAA